MDKKLINRRTEQRSSESQAGVDQNEQEQKISSRPEREIVIRSRAEAEGKNYSKRVVS